MDLFSNGASSRGVAMQYLSHNCFLQELKNGSVLPHVLRTEHLATDEECFGEKVVVRPANESEQINFHRIADPKYFEGRWVYADKGSASRRNRNHHKENNMRSGIMHKASSNKPLSHSRKTFNKIISRKRWRVEQSTGYLNASSMVGEQET